MLRPCFECCMLSIQFHREVIVDSSPASEPLTPHVKNNAQRASLFFCNFQHFCYFDNLLPNFGRNSGYMLCAGQVPTSFIVVENDVLERKSLQLRYKRRQSRTDVSSILHVLKIMLKPSESSRKKFTNHTTLNLLKYLQG